MKRFLPLFTIAVLLSLPVFCRVLGQNPAIFAPASGATTPTFVAATSTAMISSIGNNASTVAFTVSGGTNRVLVAYVGWRFNNAQTITSITYGGVALTKSTDTLGQTVNTQSALYYLINPTAGTANFATVFNTNVGHGVFIAEYDGVNQTTPFVNPNISVDNSATVTTSSVTVTSGSTNLVFDGVAHQNVSSGAFSFHTGQTSHVNIPFGDSNGGYLGCSDAPGAASVIMNETWPSADRVTHIGASFQP